MHYFDSSALLKLVFDERGSPELREFERGLDRRLSSALAEVEVLRSARRRGRDATVAASAILHRIGLLPLSMAILERAAILDPPLLRSLDAIHIASALSIRDSIDGLVTYDRRMREAAETHGITVVAPGS